LIFIENKLTQTCSGVPGELRGLEYLHKNYGKLPWHMLMQPAINLARNGFVVNADLIRYMDTTTPNSNFLTSDPSWALDFAPNGYRIKLNETMTRKRYADTLETISRKGADAFYNGPIANLTIAALRNTNGTMTTDDLKNYKITLRKPSTINYHGYKLTSCGAPAGGSVALSALNILNGYNELGDPRAVNLTTHRIDEALRFAYGQRTELGDPLFLANISDYQTFMLTEETGAAVRSRISDFTTLNVSAYNPLGYESLTTHGTSHVATADEYGLAISLTTTINTLFGSQVLVPETGVIMNNEMDDFSQPGRSNAFGYLPSPANFIRPGKRPLSSISPTIVETPGGKLYFVVGAAGGSRIITATVQNIHHVLDTGLTAPQALAKPRLHDQLTPNQVTFEWAYDNQTVDFLKSLGHNVTWIAPGQSSAQAVRVLPNGTFEAAGEPRQVNSGGYAV
jgi:gamma-glutamyltranspeptidase / glutathione hydrolase